MSPSQLSPNTKDVLKALVQAVRDGVFSEEFDIVWGMDGAAFTSKDQKGFRSFKDLSVQRLNIEALEECGLLFTRPTYHDGREVLRHGYITPAGYALVDADFANSQNSTSSYTPVEIQESLSSFLEAHPNPLRNCFLMMRFGSTELHTRLVNVIRTTLEPFEIAVHRADDREFHDDLYFNILTYVYGCAFGIAVFERIEQDDFNPNVSLEVGIMFGLGKKVCLLKDKNLKTLHTDLIGKLYKQFDPIKPEESLPVQLRTWLKDKGIIILPTS